MLLRSNSCSRCKNIFFSFVSCPLFPVLLCLPRLVASTAVNKFQLHVCNSHYIAAIHRKPPCTTLICTFRNQKVPISARNLIVSQLNHFSLCILKIRFSVRSSVAYFIVQPRHNLFYKRLMLFLYAPVGY